MSYEKNERKKQIFKVTLTKTLLTRDQPLFEKNIYLYIL